MIAMSLLSDVLPITHTRTPERMHTHTHININLFSNHLNKVTGLGYRLSESLIYHVLVTCPWPFTGSAGSRLK